MLNDISFRKFAVISLSLFLAFNGSIALDHLNISIPIVRQLFGFLFLTFIPGYTILRILRVHRIYKVEALLYALGLSLLYMMIAGVAINFTCPIIGIEKPMTLKPFIVTFSITYLMLLIWSYFRDKDYPGENISNITLKDVINPQILELSLLPILAIFGAYFFNYTGNSSLIVLIFSIIAIIPIFLLLKQRRYHLTWTIWTLAISILYVSEFGISWNYIWGYDINREYYLAHLVLTNRIWDKTISLNANAMLSIVVLNPLYSILLNMNQIMVFKIIYPFIFSLVPVGLFKAYSNFLDRKESFLAVFFFIALSIFFTEMLQLARQQIAELYLMLLILLLLEKELKINAKRALFAIFGFGLIVSHYGTTWLFLASLIMGLIVYRILYRKERKSSLLQGKYITLFVALTILWYVTTSSSSPFNTAVYIGNTILSSIYELFTPKAQGLYLITRPLSRLHKIGRYIYLTTQGFIGIGILWLFFNYKKTKINKEFVALTFVLFAYDIAGIAVPYFSNALNASRLYQLTLFFLSPFEVIGWFVLLSMLKKIVKIRVTKIVALKGLAAFLSIYLIFNSGIIYKIANDPPYLGCLDKDVLWPRWSDGEIVSGLWIKEYKNSNPIYGDSNSILLFLGLLGQPIQYNFWIDWNGNIIRPKLKDNSYLFLKEWNIKNKKLEVILPSVVDRDYISFNNPRLSSLFIQSDKIYSSQNAEYYYLIKALESKVVMSE